MREDRNDMSFLEQQDIELVAEQNYRWDKLQNKMLLISGGTGFIGRFLINVIKYRNKVFSDNIHVISLSRTPCEREENVEYRSHDITNPIEVEEKVDYVIHLASNTHPKQYADNPVGTITTNVLGCNHLLRFAVEKRAERFLLASSVEIYGNGNGREMDEKYCGYIDCNTARAGYNEAKRVSESLCQSYRAQYSIECVIARLARVFGPDRKQDSKAIAQFMKKALDGEDIVLRSRGAQRFSYCYVADAASGIFKILLDGQDGEAYNVSGDDEGRTLKDYAELIAQSVGKNVVYDFDPKANAGVSAADYAVLNCNKLKALGWKPLYGIGEAMKRTLDILSDSTP